MRPAFAKILLVPVAAITVAGCGINSVPTAEENAKDTMTNSTSAKDNANDTVTNSTSVPSEENANDTSPQSKSTEVEIDPIVKESTIDKGVIYTPHSSEVSNNSALDTLTIKTLAL